MGFPTSGVVPGVTGANNISGVNLAVLNAVLLANVASNIGKKGVRKLAFKLASREFGEEILRAAFRKRVINFLGKEWKAAFAHIAEHFNTDALVRLAKGSHSVFVKSFQSESAIKKLITQTISKSSDRYVSRAIVHGEKDTVKTVIEQGLAREFAGEPVIIVERAFGEVIGETFKLEGGQLVKTADCKAMRVIYNIQGRPISAFPIEKLGTGLPIP